MSTRGIGLREEPPRSPPRRLRVVGLTDLGPHLRRVHLRGELEGFPRHAEGAHLKLFFRREGQTQLTLPRLGPQGVIWPPPSERPIARTYSVAAFDPERGELSVDFVLHGDEGPATRWASHARLGDELGVAGPGGPNPLLGPAARYLLVGDLTAVPAIGALLSIMPSDTVGQVLIEVPSPADMLQLSAPPRVRIDWCFRAPHAPTPLPDKVRALALDAERTFAWVAGESTAVVTTRDLLLHERGFSKHQLYATPYWRERQTEEEYHAERHRIMDELAAEAPSLQGGTAP